MWKIFLPTNLNYRRSYRTCEKPNVKGLTFRRRRSEKAGLTTLLPAIPRCRDHTELLHHAQRIHLDPMFNELAISQSDEIVPGDGYLLARGRDTGEFTLMRTGEGETTGNHISFSNHMLVSDLKVREGAGKRPHLQAIVFDAGR